MSHEDMSTQLMFRNVFHVDAVFPKAQILERCSGIQVKKLRSKLGGSYVFHILYSVNSIGVVQYM